MEIPTLEDRLAAERAIGGVLFNVSNFPEKAQVRLLGQDMAPLNDKLTDAILAAGFRLQTPATDRHCDRGVITEQGCCCTPPPTEPENGSEA